MHPLYKVTHLGRPLEARYPTNRATLVLMGIALVGGAVQALVAGGGVAAAPANAPLAMLTVFFTWALGRELVPDDNTAAFIGVALAAVGWFVLGRPDVWLLACAVGFTRLTARTVGEPAMTHDTILVVLLSAGLVLWLGKSAIGIGGACALALDGLLRAPRRVHLPLAVVPLAAVGIQVARHGLDLQPVSWTIGIALVGVALAALYPQPKSTSDLRQAPLDRRRLQAGVLVATVMALAGVLLDGPAAAAPLGAALAGAALGWGVAKLRGDALAATS